jgi:hypothetical protein
MEQQKNTMKSKTETLASALRILANDIQSPDNIPATCLREAADRLEELARERDTEQNRADGHYENYCEILKQIDRIANQRDKAWHEIERLKAELHKTIESDKFQPKTTRPEPSRLEIAAWLKAGWFANRDADFNAGDHGWWIEQADRLITAAREAK